MVRPAHLAAAVLSLFAAGCNTVPAPQVETRGAVPPPGHYALITPEPAGGTAATALNACLSGLGYAAAAPAALMVQLGHAVRPLRTQVVRGAGDQPSLHTRSRREAEELVLLFTDPVSGSQLWRGAVRRALRKRDQPGDGAALVAPLCAALKDGRAAGAR